MKQMKIALFGICTALVTWYVPKWMGKEWSEGINGVLTRGSITIAAEELTYKLTSDSAYRYSAALGGFVATGLYPIYQGYNSKLYNNQRFETTVNGMIGDLLLTLNLLYYVRLCVLSRSTYYYRND